MNSDSFHEEKGRIRRLVRDRRHGLTAEWVARTSRDIANRALALPAWQAASTVACYLATPGEVDTGPILEEGRRQGKTVCVPAYDRKCRLYRLIRLTGDTEIVRGPCGVPEPRDGESVPISGIELIFVPGLAFDARGGRIGHGGGHYDRILAGAGPDTVKAGLAFGFQVYEYVPAARHDITMDIVVCEDRTIACATGKNQE